MVVSGFRVGNGVGFLCRNSCFHTGTTLPRGSFLAKKFIILRGNRFSMKESFNPNYPDISYLRQKAESKIPRFAFEYLDRGCNNEINLKRNTEDIREVLLRPYYLQGRTTEKLDTTLFGKTYSAPFGVAPIGLQGMMWPGASEILAKAAFDHNIPFILSTVATASLETISEITEGRAWFQLYNPVEDDVRNDILTRLEKAGYEVLVLLCDTPTFGYRSKEIRNGLAIPPKMTLRNIIQIAGRPHWALSTLFHGQPKFKTLTPYIPRNMNLQHLGLFMNKTFSGKLDDDKIKKIRDRWKGKLVLKGVATPEDAAKAIALGVDGIIVSNHGGRQLDQGQSSLAAMQSILKEYKDKIVTMMDSGVRNGPDIANTLACGADFVFLGRSFMYGVAALGKTGGHHTIQLLKRQLQQILEQLSCPTPAQLEKHLVKVR